MHVNSPSFFSAPPRARALLLLLFFVDVSARENPLSPRARPFVYRTSLSSHRAHDRHLLWLVVYASLRRSHAKFRKNPSPGLRPPARIRNEFARSAESGPERL